MSQNKFEQFIEMLLNELPEIVEKENLNSDSISNLIKRFSDILKHNEEEFFEIKNLTARECLLFIFGQLCHRGFEKKQIEDTMFHFANYIKIWKGFPDEFCPEDIAIQKQYEEEREEYCREQYEEESKEFKRFLNSDYNDDLDSDQQRESFW